MWMWLGRGFRVLVLAAGPGAFDLLVTETVAAGDVLVPDARVARGAGRFAAGVGGAGVGRGASRDRRLMRISRGFARRMAVRPR